MKTYTIIAATGCPTGIAHTYMAQEALEAAAKKRGISIKVETHGQEGIRNALTEAEIDAADGVIIAADKDVNADRFIGKPLINVSVSKGIKEPDQLIDEILSGNVPKYKDGQARAQQQSEHSSGQKTSIWHSIYVSLMNGVSHMLPLVVAGGVMVAISFMFGIHSAEPDSPEYNQFAYYLKTIGGISMNLMVPVLCAYIAESIAKRPGLIIGFIVGMIAYMNGTGFLGGIVGGFLTGYIMVGLAYVCKGLPKQLDGLKAIFLFPVLGIFIAGFAMWFLSAPMESINQGMMSFLSSVQDSSPILLGLIVGCMSAFDMGGPVNKAAYVTGTALLAQGNYFFMAGVSAACIAPPLATGFAVLFGGKAYSASDRSAGYVNFLLGSTHITEGAIPFAAKKPLKVIPILMLGSSIAAILTYLFKVQVPAPHGGFIVLPIVTHAILWVVAILIGAVVSGFLMSMDQKRTVAKEQEADSEKLSTPLPSVVNQSTSLDSVLDIENIFCNVDAATQDEVFQKLAKISNDHHISNDETSVIKGFVEREKLSTTGMEQGIAIPHTELESINKASIVILKLNQGVDWKALDGQPTNIVIAMFIPKGKANDHLRYLSEVSKLLIHQEFIDQLQHANSSKEIYQLFIENIQ
ncbi:fructose-specific PTS transporter subunit EIIC [Heyndrickxia oleronia]|uniref:PTS fructose transporter subunit IIABC n=1 Tax=Heyndrickxia oleronia TaxID=38875 RepID=A0A8E2IE92_9BACI|nr:fructose-specific PTS transporter subunit EIIC [Heyndrickxia oleronia]MEC1375923.1 fructose-specific PTS transporter subunit EIIC [Heyndrickxia oleronia]OOP69455.1 PTS fructose transporter subunit IIABC [Heyndrickxia oleronia]QQZ05632.1 PTS sugar transporter subunit IIA [Heyndrickxia oleronia]